MSGPLDLVIELELSHPRSTWRSTAALCLVASLGILCGASAWATVPAATARRSYYLTDTSFRTTDAVAACAPDYHMASLWEILDVSNLRYAREHPDARDEGDAGEGPPGGWLGWVRTGGVASGFDVAGRANCLGWTSNSFGQHGTTVRLRTDWNAGPREAIGPWLGETFTCNHLSPVWCVSDLSRLEFFIAEAPGGEATTTFGSDAVARGGTVADGGGVASSDAVASSGEVADGRAVAGGGAVAGR